MSAISTRLRPSPGCTRSIGTSMTFGEGGGTRGLRKSGAGMTGAVTGASLDGRPPPPCRPKESARRDHPYRPQQGQVETHLALRNIPSEPSRDTGDVTLTGHYRRSRELAAGVRPYGCEIINPCVGIGAASLPSAQAPFAVVLASSSKLFSSAAVSAATLEARDACAAGPPFCRSHRQRASRLRQRHMASGMTNDQRHERDRRTMQQ
jgi:hypothetical protein